MKSLSGCVNSSKKLVGLYQCWKNKYINLIKKKHPVHTRNSIASSEITVPNSAPKTEDKPIMFHLQKLRKSSHLFKMMIIWKIPNYTIGIICIVTVILFLYLIL